MLYAIVALDHPGSLPARRKARPDHLKRLEVLQDEGRLVMAGPFPAIDSPAPGEQGFSGSLIVAEFDTQEAAEVWAAEDPYRAAGVYREVSVRPFLQVFPK